MQKESDINEKPDFRTINIFRRKFIDTLGGLLKQTVKIGLEQGVITLEDVSIDGTKIRANASKKSVKNPKNLEKLLNRFEKSLEKDIELDKKEDKEHDKEHGDMEIYAGNLKYLKINKPKNAESIENNLFNWVLSVRSLQIAKNS